MNNYLENRTKRGIAIDLRIAADRLIASPPVVGVDFEIDEKHPSPTDVQTTAATVLRKIARHLEHGGTIPCV